MLKTAILFKDHMIIQHEKNVIVWGTGDAGAKVTVTMQGKSVETGIDQNGNWRISLGPFQASFEEEMVIASGEEKIVLKDVQVGEVWLAGGQSNMEFHMRYDADIETETGRCLNENIRFFDYPEVSYVGQIDEADYGKNYGFWRKARPEEIERFSAVGYYFAKELQNRYQVPFGIIGCNWGGTPACAWMSEEAVTEGGGQIYLDEYTEAVKKLNLNEYDEAFKKNPSSWRVDLLADPISDAMMRGSTDEEASQSRMEEMNAMMSQIDWTAYIPVMGPKYESRPSGLYHSMLTQIAPYTIRGIIWYQGETDGDTRPELYKTLFPALIKNWRELWEEELPFLFVQIAPLDHWMAADGERYIAVREAQQEAADTVQNTGMAVITDAGMRFDVHPKKKQPVGYRLALLAEKKVYGEDILCEAPTLTEVLAEKGRLTLAFENAGTGLYLKENLPHGQKIGKHRLGGLQVFQNGKELPTDGLEAQAEGSRVILSGDFIQEGVPTQVKIACTGWYLVNLYNSAGIPARPASKEVK